MYISSFIFKDIDIFKNMNIDTVIFRLSTFRIFGCG
jgi:hypothetical protein